MVTFVVANSAVVVSEKLENPYVTAAEADMDNSIKRKRFRVFLKISFSLPIPPVFCFQPVNPVPRLIADRRSGSFYSGICHHIRAGRERF